MTSRTGSRAVILGGAGFLGSRIARHLSREGHDVTVIDGLLPRTGGSWDNLNGVRDHITIRQERVEEMDDLPQILAAADLVVDAMAWTSHREAMADPLWDLELNAASHLHVIPGLQPRHRVILLGSIGQYGDVRGDIELDENARQEPADIQGIHKFAAEKYFQIYSGRRGFSGASLRIPNAFGEGQKTDGDDIGLVGSFIRDLLDDREVIVHGHRRSRSLVYGDDVAAVVAALAKSQEAPFEPLNLAGTPLRIRELADLLQSIIGRGSVRILDVEAGDDLPQAKLVDDRLRERIGSVPRTPVEEALRRTVDYFAEAA